jgi:hypothetical protein
MEEIRNHFCDDNKDLLVLDSRDLADPTVINDLRQIDLPLFSKPPVREMSRTQLQVPLLKNDCSMFSSLFIASQT